jgi:transcription initiation factor TFIIIB Brf1 subunit/transcription initiation factor TFIIB
MAMETIRCPYCECKVLMSDVEDDDGVCPECGAPLLGSLFADDSADDQDDEAETDIDVEADVAPDIDDDLDDDPDDDDDDDRDP